MALFRDRREAGRKLAHELAAYANRTDVLVLALPRGGVPVAYEVARALNVPMDIYVVRKLGVPGHEELAMGAIAPNGVRVLNQDILQKLQVPPEAIDTVARAELQELQRREHAYRGGRLAPTLRGHTVILIDDGLATGASMRAAIAGVRAQNPAQIVIAVPTAALETCEALAPLVDKVICANTPEPFDGVSRWYDDFAQITDEDVHTLLEASHPSIAA
jgi:predicted phosphoribosyltransferase